MRLYTVVEAVPSRILGLVRLLQCAKRQERPRDEVVSLLQPATLRKGASGEADMATKIIGASLELGIVDAFENDAGDSCLRLSESARKPYINAEHREHWAIWIARRVLRELTDGPSRNMATICAWLMTITVDDVPQDEANWKKRFSSDGFDIDELKSDARWHNIFYWTHFWGLTWQITSDKTAGIVCDPSVLIRRFLDEIIAPEETIPADVFRDRLGKSLPILDGGLVHQEVRERVATARGELQQIARISPGVSMAIRELRDRGELNYYCPDDQRTFLLLDDGEKFAFASRSARRAL